MDIRSYKSYILMGIGGAVASTLLVETFFWIFSLGRTIVDFFWGTFVFLPVPIVVGGIAGTLSRSLPSLVPVGLTFWFGVLGMLFGFFGGVFVYDFLIELYGRGYQLLGFVVPMVIGTVFELIIFGIVWLGMKIHTSSGRTSS